MRMLEKKNQVNQTRGRPDYLMLVGLARANGDTGIQYDWVEPIQNLNSTHN